LLVRSETLIVSAIILVMLFGIHPLAPHNNEELGELKITTDKCSYSVGELVRISFSNMGNGTIEWPSMGFPSKVPYEIFDEEGDLVWQIQLEADVIWGLSHGEQYNTTWNQTYNAPSTLTGEQVPKGAYRIYAEGFAGGLGSNVTTNDSIWIWIGLPCGGSGPFADGGPNQTVYEGEVVQFDGKNSTGSVEEFGISVGDNVIVNLPGDVHDWMPGVATDQDGVVYIAWSTLNMLKFAKSLDGKSFENHTDVSPAKGERPFVHADSNGTVYITFGCGNVCFVRSDDGGETFGNVTFANDHSGSALQPSVVVDASGTIHVSWYDTRDGLWDVYFAKSTDGGWTFSQDVKVNDDSRDYPQVYPPHTTMSIDDSGNIYVAWNDNRNGDFDIYFARSLDGGQSFETNLRVSDDMGYADQLWPSMIVDKGGIIHIVWEDLRDGSRAIYHAQSVDEGQNFSVNRKLTLQPETTDLREPRIAVTNVGDLYLVWMGGKASDHDVFISASSDAGNSFLPGMKLNNDTGTSEQRYPELVVGNDGIAHVVWSDSRNNPQGQSWDIYYCSAHMESGAEAGIVSYEWDFDASIDSNGDGNFTNDTDATGPTPTWVYGDDGDFTVTLKVTDELGNWDIDTMNVSVLNVLPDVTANYTCKGGGPSDILLRIAGEKSHDASLIIYEDDDEIYNETVVRLPGSPNEQTVGLEAFALEASRSHSTIVRYTPEDDRINGQIRGATPAWIILKSGGNEVARLHHIFNVRHPETWEWRVDDLNSYFPQRECVFIANISDPGSDDMYITWDWGDGTTTERLYYNDGVGPDPYPSPEVNPAHVMDTAKHSYASGGSYTVTLTVMDDDAGQVQLVFIIDI